MRKFKKIDCLLLFLLFFCCFPLLTACQSADKTDVYLKTEKIEEAEFTYDAVNDETFIVWSTTLTNNSIYNFRSFYVTFRLYNGSELVETKTCNYNIGVEHGKSYTGKFNFYANKKIDNIKFVSWGANSDSLGETYKIWFIVTGILSGIFSLIYIIVMAVLDLDFESWLDNWWIFLLFLLPVAVCIWQGIISSWVPVLIVFGGVFAFFLIATIAQAIKSAVG